MTEFRESPYQTVEIKNLVKIDFAEFQKRRVLEGSTAKYCDGVIFAIFRAPDNAETVRAEIAGTMYWLYCEVAEVAEKITSLKHDGLELPVLDVSTNKIYVDFTDWLKKQPVWSTK